MKSIFFAMCCISFLVCGQAEAVQSASGQGFIDAKMGNIIPEQARAIGLDKTRTVLVEVFPHGPAAKAGLRPNDVILSIDGESMADSEACTGVIASKAPGTQIKIVVWRNGHTQELTPTLGERPQALEQAQLPSARAAQARQTAAQANISPSDNTSIDIQNVPCIDIQQCLYAVIYGSGDKYKYDQNCKIFFKKELPNVTDEDIATIVDKHAHCRKSTSTPVTSKERNGFLVTFSRGRDDVKKQIAREVAADKARAEAEKQKEAERAKIAERDAQREEQKQREMRERQEAKKAAKEAAQKLCPGLEKEVGTKYKNHYIIVGPEMSITPEDGITLYDLVAAAQQKGMFKKFTGSGIFSSAITLELEGMSIDFQSKMLSAETFLEVGTSYKGQIINVLIATEVTRPDGRKNRIGNSQAEMFLLIGLFGGTPLHGECR